MSGNVILKTTNESGYFVVEGLPLLGPAWGIFEDVSVVFNPAEWRGDSYLVPHRPGRIPQPLVLDEQTVKWKLLIAGDVDHEGDPFDDPVEGVRRNERRLRQVLDPPSPIEEPDGCRSTVLHASFGTTLAQRVQWTLDLRGPINVGRARNGRPGALKRATLTMRMPDGYFPWPPS